MVSRPPRLSTLAALFFCLSLSGTADRRAAGAGLEPLAAHESQSLVQLSDASGSLAMPWERPVPNRGPYKAESAPPDLSKQTEVEAERKSKGCNAANCHAGIDKQDMHPGEPGNIGWVGCTDCHGGNAAATNKDEAHVKPRYPEDAFKNGAPPVRSYALLNDESPEYVRFINPSDLRSAWMACGGCHTDEVKRVRKSMMATAAMLWEAALYSNGQYPEKTARFGESYTPDGRPARVRTEPAPDVEELRRGVLPYLDPLPRFEITQPGNLLRVFERGNDRLSIRGLGTKTRTDPVFLSLQKTRLLDPTLWFIGTNDHPGDYRASGCAACHVIYANDRDSNHSAQYAQYGNLGHTASNDKAIPRGVSGFPIKHQFTNQIPSSQCMVCHVHPGTNVLNSYYGTIWWDNETDGELFYPVSEKHPSADEIAVALMSNPEAASIRGLWSDPAFLADSWKTLNPKLKHTKIADFHGHGWIFRYVYKQDVHGNLLNGQGRIVRGNRLNLAVKLEDIHEQLGMQCADCHFRDDAHGDGKLYGEVRNAITIRCEDCHGTLAARAKLTGTGNAGRNRSFKGDTITEVVSNRLRTLRRFPYRRGEIVQQPTMNPDPKEVWKVPQLPDVDRTSVKAAYYHTIQKDGKTAGDPNIADSQLAHPLRDMSCQTCHSSWVPSCFGCHLPMKANMRRPILHFDGDMTRNWTSYDFQTLRNDVFMLGRDGVVTGNRISPARSSCAVLVSSYNARREVLYTQQQPVSSEGLSAESFSTTAPHTVRAKETKQCTDCHISEANDNNAKMAQLLMEGTNFVNFIGRFAWVAEGRHGLDGVAVTERDEPQAVIGSYLHKLAYPEEFASHVANRNLLKEAYHHEARNCLSIQNRGEYLYTADGAGGLNVYDIAHIDDKSFSERIITAPVSPLGQRTYVKTKFATAVALPSTLLIDPARLQRPENREQKVAKFYAYAYVTDKYEGLITVNVATLGDGNPDNNFLYRGATFNPGGILNGATNLTIAGNYAYIAADAGIVVVDISDPLAPRLVATVGSPHIVRPRAIALQFRYAFVVDAEGLKVLDVTFLGRPKPVDSAAVPIADARNIYVARTYAYISGGAQGLLIFDVERPEHPKLDQVFNAGGAINDLNDTKLGMTDASLFGYLADGRNGLRVVQMTSPETPGNFGFSPRVHPQVIATYRTWGSALAVAKGVDRDRAVDESGNQLAVFDRLGARPFTLAEMQKLYLRNGEVYSVSDEPPSGFKVGAQPGK